MSLRYERVCPSHTTSAFQVLKHRAVESFLSGTYLRRIDSCITQLKAQGPFMTCNESKEE